MSTGTQGPTLPRSSEVPPSEVGVGASGLAETGSSPKDPQTPPISSHNCHHMATSTPSGSTPTHSIILKYFSKYILDITRDYSL